MRIYRRLTLKNMRMNFWGCSLIIFLPLFAFCESTDGGKAPFLFVGDKEVSVSVSEGLSTTLVSFKRGSEVVREHFSADGNLTLREWWEVSPEVKRVKYQTFKYAPALISSSIISDKEREEISYESSGKEREVRKYNGNFLEQKVNFLYTPRGKIKEKTTRNYFKDKDEDERREIFSYKGDEKSAAEFYENGTLRRRITYEGAGDFVEEVFFHSSFSTKTFYKDFKRQRVMFYRDGELLRRQEYEKF